MAAATHPDIILTSSWHWSPTFQSNPPACASDTGGWGVSQFTCCSWSGAVVGLMTPTTLDPHRQWNARTHFSSTRFLFFFFLAFLPPLTTEIHRIGSKIPYNTGVDVREQVIKTKNPNIPSRKLSRLPLLKTVSIDYCLFTVRSLPPTSFLSRPSLSDHVRGGEIKAW